MDLRNNKQGLLGYAKDANEGGILMNNKDDTSGARLLYRYREENVTLATKLKEIKSFIETFESSQKFEQKELYGLASSIANYVDTNWNFKLVGDSIISREILDQIFTKISNHSQSIIEIIDKILASIERENHSLGQFIKSKRSFIEASQEIDQVISNFIYEQDILKHELGKILPNLSQLVDQTDLLETQEVETLATNYITFYYELERLIKEPNSSKDEIFAALQKICFFLRNFIGSLEKNLDTTNEDNFLHELGIHKDEKNKQLKEHFEKRGITKDAITHPRIFAQNFFNAARGKIIVESLQSAIEKEDEKERNKVAQKVLKSLSHKIGKLEEEVTKKYKEKVDTSKIEEEYWEQVGIGFNNQIVNLNNQIKDNLSNLSGFHSNFDKSKLNYLDLLFELPTSNFGTKLNSWRKELEKILPKINLSADSLDPSLMLGNFSSASPEEVQTKVNQLGEEEKHLYEELEFIHNALNQRVQENQRLMEQESQLAMQVNKTTRVDKKGAEFTEEYSNLEKGMKFLYERMQKIYFEYLDYEKKRSEKTEQIRKLKDQIIKVQTEIEKLVVKTIVIGEMYEIEQMLGIMKSYYFQYVHSNFAEKLIEAKDKKDDNSSKKDAWSKLNKGFSGCFESFSF